MTEDNELPERPVSITRGPDEATRDQMKMRCADTMLGPRPFATAYHIGVEARVDARIRPQPRMPRDRVVEQPVARRLLKRPEPVPPLLLEALFNDLSRWKKLEADTGPVQERVLPLRQFGQNFEALKAHIETALCMAGIDQGVTIRPGDKVYCESHRGDLVVRIDQDAFRASAMTDVLRADRVKRSVTGGSTGAGR